MDERIAATPRSEDVGALGGALSVDNDVFFGVHRAPHGEPSVPEVVFYAGRPRPEAETPWSVRAAATPIRFALVLFLVGWAGILFQASFLQQVVIGAPVFEELAKIGPPLLVVSLLRVRTLWIRLPLAWASGAAFGVMEHYVTYAEEPLGMYVERVLFHTASPGLSMLLYGAVEGSPDLRARWITTVPATLFHWLNNFAAVVLGFAGILLPASPDAAAVALGVTITSAMIVLTLGGILLREPFERTVREALAAAIPRLGFGR